MISMAECQIAVTPVRQHWSYRSVALSHQYDNKRVYTYKKDWNIPKRFSFYKTLITNF